MKLSKLLRKVNYITIMGNLKDVDIIDITRDSREVNPGDLYIAVVGENIDGHSFISSVEKKKPCAIVHSKELETYDEEICYIKVRDTRKCMSEISKAFFNVKGNLKVIGITGTNGKTTSAFMMKHVLESAGYKVGLIGTIANYIGNKMMPTERTTPESIDLFKLIRDMKLEHCDYCVMEVSSHAAVLGRIDGIDFLSGSFTNLTQDHLDFHKTFEEYYKAKYKFINSCETRVINIDDIYGRTMIEELSENSKYSSTYGINDGEYRAQNVNINANGSNFDIVYKNNVIGKVRLPIAGTYNVYNALGVIATLLSNNIVSTEEAIKGLNTMKAIPGRCENVYHENLKPTVIVDYAHTPDGLENILKTLKKVVKRNIITVFGCGGNRDIGKRPIMGLIASKYSNFVVVTSDNPRTENPNRILADIVRGISGEYTVIPDRQCAIEFAISIAEENDIVLIAGKGHEDYQIIGNEKVYFSDRETVLNFCNILTEK